MKLEHLLIEMVIRKKSFYILPKKTLCFVGYPAILALEVTKGQTLLPRLPWSCLISRLVYPIMILNIVSNNIFFPPGKIIGMVRLRRLVVFLQAVLEGWSYLVLCPHRSYISDPFIYQFIGESLLTLLFYFIVETITQNYYVMDRLFIIYYK